MTTAQPGFDVLMAHGLTPHGNFLAINAPEPAPNAAVFGIWPKGQGFTALAGFLEPLGRGGFDVHWLMELKEPRDTPEDAYQVIVAAFKEQLASMVDGL